MRRIIEVRELSLPEVKAILEKLSKEKELNYIQKLTLDYASKFSKLPHDLAVKLKEELVKQHGLSTFAAIQIVNIMPGTIEELRTILAKEGRVFTTDELQEILNTLKKYYQIEETSQ
ncbi:MAG: hypothetical protein DRN15_08285 [Thermoprotei archaeon]|nr:MAG: hypothetical protein DRN15_08285 [Thermoprotei archaeon]